ncbi:type IV secretion system protein VirB10 [Pinirhizobacter sp.]|jgi:type IV secretion system protein VirB10|uniref:type IV secretion system protein VirB10 n=1 Tax=Pinirhizobacter sp. TaxID=2950432 RepID=UPI002F3E8750
MKPAPEATTDDDQQARGIPQVGGKKKGNRWTTLLVVGASAVLIMALGSKVAIDRLRNRDHDANDKTLQRGLPNLARGAFDANDLKPPVVVKPPDEPAAATPAQVKAKAVHDDLAERRKRAPLIALGGKAGGASGYSGTANNQGVADDSRGSLGGALQATQRAAARGYQLRDPSLTITQGAFLDCTLVTAINSTLPGMTTCVLSRDVFSTDGRTLLLERGSRLVGQYQAGQIRQGMKRIFLLWTRVQTPQGVLVDLDSPSVDSLGRSGVDGKVNNHFWERFGSAMLVSVVDDVVQAALQNQQQASNGGTSISFNNTGQATQSAAAVIVQNTVNIPPTLDKAQGSRIGVFVARDLYFGDVYQLRQKSGLP